MYIPPKVPTIDDVPQLFVRMAALTPVLYCSSGTMVMFLHYQLGCLIESTTPSLLVLWWDLVSTMELLPFTYPISRQYSREEMPSFSRQNLYFGDTFLNF